MYMCLCVWLGWGGGGRGGGRNSPTGTLYVIIVLGTLQLHQLHMGVLCSEYRGLCVYVCFHVVGQVL